MQQQCQSICLIDFEFRLIREVFCLLKLLLLIGLNAYYFSLFLYFGFRSDLPSVSLEGVVARPNQPEDGRVRPGVGPGKPCQKLFRNNKPQPLVPKGGETGPPGGDPLAPDIHVERRRGFRDVWAQSLPLKFGVSFRFKSR